MNTAPVFSFTRRDGSLPTALSTIISARLASVKTQSCTAVTASVT